MKKRKTKKAKKVLGIIAAVLAVFILSSIIATLVSIRKNTEIANSFETVQVEDRLTPVKDENGYWTFTTDRDFKVLQITDIHIGGGWLSTKKDSKALNAVASMVAAEKPDLIVVTGDIAFPVPYAAGTFNNLSSAKMFAALMEKLGIYWTITFGNHDTEIYSYYNRKEISDFYENSGFQYCLYQSGPQEVDGYGNHVINVKNSAGEITQSIFMIDSHAYTDEDPLGIRWIYDNIHDNQVEWYENTLKKINLQNNAVLSANGKQPVDTVKSLMFIHIPLTEQRDAWFEYAANGYKDTENAKLVYGVAGETDRIVYCGAGEDRMFESILEQGSTQAVFFGHDHKNNFAINYKGVQLSYSYSIDYLAYIGIAKEGAQRGCTVIDIRPDGSFSSHLENYYQDKYISLYEKEQVTMQEVTYG